MNSLLLFVLWLACYFKSVHLSYEIYEEDPSAEIMFLSSPIWAIFGFIIIPCIGIFYLGNIFRLTFMKIYKFYLESLKEFKERK